MKPSIYLPYERMQIHPDESFVSCLSCVPRAWVLFANEEWGRVFENRGAGLDLVKEFTRHKIVNIFEPLSFTDRMSAWLDESLWNNRFDHLILVAPAHMLSLLNKTLSLPVLARTIAEVNWPAGERKAQAGKAESPAARSLRKKIQ